MTYYPPQGPSGQEWPGQQLPPGQQAQPMYYPPPARPKKSKTWLWILALLVTSLLSCLIGATLGRTPTNTTTSNVDVSNATWITTHTFTGNGIKKTATITVGDNWKLLWKCTSAANGNSYNLIVSVYTSSNSLQSIAVNEICDTGNMNGETQEHQGGNIYLDVNSEGPWTLTMEEPA